MTLTPVYRDPLVTLYHGDALDVLPTLDPVPLIVTSPPYNKGLRVDGRWTGPPTRSSKSSRFRDGYGDGDDDALPMPEYERQHRMLLTAMIARLADAGAIFYNHKPRIINGELWTPLRLLPQPSLLRQIIVWHTGPGVNIMPGAFVPAHEWIMLITKPGFTLASRDYSTLSDVWTFAPEKSTPEHPAPFPLALPIRALEATDARLVLDPFAGTGTTLIAARMLGIPSIGIERSEQHCQGIIERLRQIPLLLYGAERVTTPR